MPRNDRNIPSERERTRLPATRKPLSVKNIGSTNLTMGRAGEDQKAISKS